MPKARPGQRPSGGAPLAALLGAERFRLGPRTARVLANLAAHGGGSDERAAAWIGADLPPHGAPSVTLGPARGTLGPFSFGFLDNRRPVAAYAGALDERPRPGAVALVCGRREALPEVAPLAVARGLGVSWIVSVGDGDAAEVLAFLGKDGATRAVLLSAHAEAGALAGLDGKPVVVLGGDPLTRSAARRRGGAAVDDLEEWLAHGLLLDAGVIARPSRPRAIVVGGGAAVLAEAARSSGLTLPIDLVSDDDPDELARAIAEARDASDLLLVAGAGAGDFATLPGAPSLRIDLGRSADVRALCGALARLAGPPAPPIPRVRADRENAQAVVDASDGALSDHDTKRVLKSYGVTVSRQAPAGSATAAVRVAAQIGFPVDVVAGEAVRRAATVAELRRITAITLGGAHPFVLVRQAFPAAPRARFAIERVRGLGLVATLGPERALLPLERDDALVLARAASGSDGRTLVDLLARTSSAAVELDLTFELELFVGDEPAIVAASGKRR